MKLTLPAKIESHNLFRPAGDPRGRHMGEDYGWRNGDHVFAAADGIVVGVWTSGYNQGWGLRVRIKHADGTFTTYNHFAPGTIRVKYGQKVKDGDLLGTMGDTGLSSAKHLHFELELGGPGSGFRVNPRPYFTKDLPGTSTSKPIEGSPASGVKLKPYQRVVRKLQGDAWLNGRKSATTKAEVLQRLEPETVGTFSHWRKGQKVTIDGVTSDIWFRGKYKKRWFAAAGFTDRSTTGLKKYVTVLKPRATKKSYFKTPKDDSQYYFTEFSDAYYGRNFTRKRMLPAGGKIPYLVLENPKRGPVKIKVPGVGNVWVGTHNHPAKLVKL